MEGLNAHGTRKRHLSEMLALWDRHVNALVDMYQHLSEKNMKNYEIERGLIILREQMQVWLRSLCV